MQKRQAARSTQPTELQGGKYVRAGENAWTGFYRNHVNRSFLMAAARLLFSLAPDVVQPVPHLADACNGFGIRRVTTIHRSDLEVLSVEAPGRRVIPKLVPADTDHVRMPQRGGDVPGVPSCLPVLRAFCPALRAPACGFIS